MGVETSPSFAFASPAATNGQTNLPTVTDDYAIQSDDLGAILDEPGITATLPPYDASQMGRKYYVPNHSGGVAFLAASSGEQILMHNGTTVTSLTIPPSSSRTLLRETTNNRWNIV